MRRCSTKTLLGLAALALWMPAVAQGQNITVQVLDVEGRDANFRDLTQTPLGLEDCLNGRTVTVRLTGISQDTNRIDIWWGTGCNAVEPRRDAQNTSCQHVGNRELEFGAKNQQTLTFTARDILRIDDTITGSGGTTATDGGVPDAGAIGGGGDDGLCRDISSEASLFFLATNMQMSTEDVGGAWGSVEVAIDTRPPDPPVNVRGGAAEREFPVDWEYAGAGSVLRFRVYWDPDSDADCNSDVLQEGAPAPRDIEGVRSKRVDTPTARETTLTDAIPVGSQAAVAMTAMDQAFNESALSAPGCLEGVPTYGVWPPNGPDGELPEQGCAVASGTHASWIVLLVAGGLLWRRRRWR